MPIVLVRAGRDVGAWAPWGMGVGMGVGMGAGMGTDIGIHQSQHLVCLYHGYGQGEGQDKSNGVTMPVVVNLGCRSV